MTTLITHIVAEFDRETARSRRALEHVPDHQREWKPHDTSMAFGYLADMVATIPMWLTAILTRDNLDIAPKDGQGMAISPSTTSAEFLAALEKAAAEARKALAATSDDHLQTNWKLLAAGQVVAGGDAAGDADRLHQPLGPSSRTVDGISASHRRTRPGALRAVG